MADDHGTRPVPGAPSDNTTLVAVVGDLRAQGFAADLQPIGADGSMRCSACGNEVAAADVQDVVERRLEGASDPADMLLVASAHCPVCGAGGVLTLTYGPAAGEADAAVVARLPRPDSIETD